MPTTFPPYAYVPGLWPHPTRHAAGHSRNHPTEVPAPLDPARWRSSEAYLRGIELFDHGYYWESHEAWERLWLIAARDDGVRELLQGLIQLAAAGVKLRQGWHAAARRLGTSAAQHFVRARQLCDGAESLAGLTFGDLFSLTDELHTQVPVPCAAAETAVCVVFRRRLGGGSAPPPPP